MEGKKFQLYGRRFWLRKFLSTNCCIFVVKCSLNSKISQIRTKFGVFWEKVELFRKKTFSKSLKVANLQKNGYQMVYYYLKCLFHLDCAIFQNWMKSICWKRKRFHPFGRLHQQNWREENMGVSWPSCLFSRAKKTFTNKVPTVQCLCDDITHFSTWTFNRSQIYFYYQVKVPLQWHWFTGNWFTVTSFSIVTFWPCIQRKWRANFVHLQTKSGLKNGHMLLLTRTKSTENVNIAFYTKLFPDTPFTYMAKALSKANTNDFSTNGLLGQWNGKKFLTRKIFSFSLITKS